MGHSRRGSIFVLLALALLVGAGGWWSWGRTETLPEGLIQANGRIEGDRILASTRYPGRVVELLVREGSEVEAGQVVARLDDAQSRARVDQARAAVESEEARLRAARKALEVLERDVPLKIESARSEVAHAEAALAAAEANERQSGKDAARLAALHAQGSVDAQRAERAALAWKMARAELTSARTALAQARNALADAKLGRRRIDARRAEIAALEAQLAQARAALAEAESRLEELTITAPASGIVTTRVADLGEVVGAGFPLFEIVDLDRLYLQVYVPEKEIGKIRLGLPARIYTDAFPEKPFPATVRHVASRAEFTPKEVQTPDERVKLVYAVKLQL
ncbi:MAG TPA: HlyD family efflux transporter periplasmic adaptor subunit, partial [Deltaproteobacteria bacterium]|nr:HlyD family efflux transporter periplasmic adaptor subunit [Deltaproteobacteria bacterium]